MKPGMKKEAGLLKLNCDKVLAQVVMEVCSKF